MDRPTLNPSVHIACFQMDFGDTTVIRDPISTSERVRPLGPWTNTIRLSCYETIEDWSRDSQAIPAAIPQRESNTIAWIEDFEQSGPVDRNSVAR